MHEALYPRCIGGFCLGDVVFLCRGEYTSIGIAFDALQSHPPVGRKRYRLDSGVVQETGMRVLITEGGLRRARENATVRKI